MTAQFAFTSAYTDFSRGLNMRALFKVNDQAVADDLVQDTFLKTWKYLVKGGKIDMMKAFLYHILNNLIIDYYRKHKACSLDFMLESGFDYSDTNQQELFMALDAKALVLLIKFLPKPYQKVMRMRYVDDLTLAEMSENTGQSKNSIAVLAHRGLGKLRLLYKAR